MTRETGNCEAHLHSATIKNACTRTVTYLNCLYYCIALLIYFYQVLKILRVLIVFTFYEVKLSITLKVFVFVNYVKLFGIWRLTL